MSAAGIDAVRNPALHPPRPVHTLSPHRAPLPSTEQGAHSKAVTSSICSMPNAYAYSDTLQFRGSNECEVALVVLQVGVTNGILGGISSLTKLNSLHIADAYRVTNIGLQFVSTLTGVLSLAECLSTTSKEYASLPRSSWLS